MAFQKFTLPILVIATALVVLIPQATSLQCFNCNSDNPACSDDALHPTKRNASAFHGLNVTCDKGIKDCILVELKTADKTTKERRCATQGVFSFGCNTEKGVTTCNHMCNHDLCNSGLVLSPLSFAVLNLALSIAFYTWSH